MIRKLKRFVRTLLFGEPKVGLIAKVYPQYSIGRGSYGPLEILDFGEGKTFSMGAWCSVAIGSKVMLGGGHRTEWATTYPFTVTEPTLAHIKGHPVSRGDVHIGNDVWLGREALIMSGVTIGNGAVIAARALVTRDVPPYAIVGGTPAKVISYRFPEEIIARLQALNWWDWSEDRIRAAAPDMLDANVERFLDMAERGDL